MAQFTQSQQAAISHRGHNVLVSASAGSGKTTVLIERIVQQVFAGQDLHRLLIVTFTNAATAEMRLRLANALKERFTKTRDQLAPELRGQIANQIATINGAPIMTLDAFSLQVVKQYYYVIGLDPGFRLLTDDTERQMVQDNVWADLCETLYASEEHAPTFTALAQNFSPKENDAGLAEVVAELLRFADTTTDPQAWLTNFTKAYEPATFDETFATQTWPLLQQQLQETAAGLQDIQQNAAEEPAFTAIAQSLATAVAQLTTAASLDHPTYAAAQEALATDFFPRWPGVKRGSDDDIKAGAEVLKHQRETLKKRFNREAKGLVAIPTGQLHDALVAMQPLMAELRFVAVAYWQALQTEKEARQLQDFSDIAHHALTILQTVDPQTGHPVGQLFQAQYDEVLVDEYQDINALQEALLLAVSRQDPGDRFMVGDVKQSIYGFRLAAPQLFLAKYAAYADPAEPGERIILAENFRSAQNILNFTNLLFSQLMDRQVGELDYDEAAQLQYGATDIPADFAPPIELLLNVQPDAVDDAADDAETPAGIDKTQRETQLVIGRIQQLVNNEDAVLYDRKAKAYRRIQYRDITLLARSRSQNITIQSEFAKAGVPIIVADAQNYFKTTELMIMLSLLRVIDDPQQDIALVAVLRSPIVGLSADQLALIRLADKQVPYYDALQLFLQPDDQASPFKAQTQATVQQFMAQLAEFRDFARSNELVALIWHIYEVTGLLDFVGGLPGGPQRQANLRALASRAATYENGGFKGLFTFIHFIELMQKQDKDLALPVVLDPAADAVSLMTIHGSKGLEFPVVFLLGADKQFNLQDLTANVIMTQSGVGAQYVDPATQVQYDLPQYLTQKMAKADQLRAEEMRLLYVALTRAEQRLIIVGTAADEQKTIAKWQTLGQGAGVLLPSGARRQAKSYLDWVGMSLARHPDFADAVLTEPALAPFNAHFTVSFVADITPTTRTATGEPVTQPALDVAVPAWLAWQYPQAAATRTTGFQTVTEIKRAFDDPDTIELVQATGTLGGNRLVSDLAKPAFMQATKQVTATAVGTATHLVLQTLALTQPVTAERVAAQLATLVKTGAVTPEVAARVNTAALAMFFDTPLGQAIQTHQGTLHRETPFSLLLPAKQIFSEMAASDDDILIHGIIDGYYDTGADIVLFDYKTDRLDPDEQALVTRYRGQLNLYAEALTQLTGKAVTKRYLIALASGVAVDVGADE